MRPSLPHRPRKNRLDRRAAGKPVFVTQDLEGLVMRLMTRYYSKRALAPYSPDQRASAAREVCAQIPSSRRRTGMCWEFTSQELIDLVEQTYRRLLTADAVAAAAEDPASGIVVLPGIHPDTGASCRVVHCLNRASDYLDLVARLKEQGRQADAEHLIHLGRARFGKTWPRGLG